MSGFSKCKENLHPKCVVGLFLFVFLKTILQHLNADNNKKLTEFHKCFAKSVYRFTQLMIVGGMFDECIGPAEQCR